MSLRKGSNTSLPDVEMLSPPDQQNLHTIPYQDDEPKTAKKVFLDKILLNEGILPVNFYSSWGYVLFLGIIAITYTTLEPEYIHRELGISEAKMGKTTAWLYLYDYTIRLFCALLYGPLIDHYGRKTVMAVGIFLVSLGYFVVPILNQSFFPGYFVAKTLYSGGIIGLQMLPLAADYVDNSTKGIMAALNFGVAFLGGGIGAGLLKVLSLFESSYIIIYWTLAGIIFFLGFGISLGIKGGNTYYKKGAAEAQGQELTDRNARWEGVKKAFREDPWVNMSIIFGVLGNTDFYILTTGLVIWIRSLVPEGVDPIGVTANYQAIFALTSLILTGYMAFKIDKMPHMKIIMPILIVATLGFILVPLVGSATSPLLYIFFLIEGASLPGILVYSSYFAYRYYPSEIRGTLSGIANAICFLGAIVILSIGGVLHDSWRKDASFLLYAMLMVISLILVIVIQKTMIKGGGVGSDSVSMLALKKNMNIDRHGHHLDGAHGEFDDSEN